MKRVFSNHLIPHLWAHQTQDSARNANHSLYFEGNTIYSYGSHFPIARHIEQNGEKAILVTTRSYSVTTSQHVSRVRMAIPNSATVFHVEDVTADDIDAHTDNAQTMAREVNKEVNEMVRARTAYSKTWKHNRAIESEQELCKYCAFFGIDKPETIPVPALDAGQLQKLEQREAQRKATAAANEALRNREKIEQWKLGASVYLGYKLPVYLRVNQERNEVQTSHGASVPIDHARRGLQIVREVVKSGVEYVKNGHTLHLGNYSVDKIETNGTLHAGCHVIPYAEIERIAPELESAVQS